MYVDCANNQYRQAGIGHKNKALIDKQIRQSNTLWIENWNQFPALEFTGKLLSNLMIEANRYFFLSMKRLEAQFAIYNPGGFYKKHLDQHQTGHRLLTCIIYLNDVEKCGELVIYNKKDRNKVDKIIPPKQGKLVLFFSNQIFHEVLPTESLRLSLTTWMRNDELHPFA